MLKKKKKESGQKKRKSGQIFLFKLAAHFNISVTFKSTAEVARTEQGDPLRGVQFSMIFFL